MIKVVAFLVLFIAVIVAGKMYLSHTRERRYRNSSLIGMRGMGPEPKRKNGNKCGCMHQQGFVLKACGKQAEAGDNAEPGLCRACRRHGPHGRNRKD